MAYDLEEQEQLDEFKAWWNKNGKTVTSIVIAGLIAYAGWQGYQYWIQKQSVEASTLYQTLVTTDTSKVAEIKSQAETLTKNFAGTPYAGRASVYSAKISYQAKDTTAAKSQLEWARNNAKESSVQAIASLELASLAYESKDYAGAEKLLNAIKDPGFAGLKDNMLGDVLLAQGKTAEAKKAFENALTSLDQQGRFYALTKQKLESLGS
jgi:predicted negative regulator of RcsB-dependent stress response